MVFSCSSYDSAKLDEFKVYAENSWESVDFVDGEASVKLMTYNIRHGAGLHMDGSLEDVAAVINASGADIIFLQEVDINVSRSGNVNQLKELARMTGLNGIFLPSITLGSGYYGNALLSSFPLTDFLRIDLATPKGMEKRAGVFAKTKLAADLIFSLVTTHLSFENAIIRDKQAEDLLEGMKFAGADTDFYIAAGDLNADPNTKTVKTFTKYFEMQADFFNYLSFPAVESDRCIDYIFVKSNNKLYEFESQGIDVYTENPLASDHLPVMSEILIKKIVD